MAMQTHHQEPVVQAAGGAVWRRHDGRVEVLLVHKPRNDDWTLPKGKLRKAEDELHGALREVEEETGLSCRLGPELPSTAYLDAKGRQKVVRYWAMHPLGGDFTPGAEVDEIRWIPLPDGVDQLTYERDRAVVNALLPLTEAAR
jgi:8-oxo-dGTP diphosphatase